MGLLNVAVMMVLFGQTPAVPAGGVTEVTVGGVTGLPGFATMFASGSPQPISNAVSDINMRIAILLNFFRCIVSPNPYCAKISGLLLFSCGLGGGWDGGR